MSLLLFLVVFFFYLISLILFLQYEPKDKPFTKQVTYWLARLINPETPVVLSNEHQDYKWLPLVEAKHLASYPEMQELLDDCENYLVKTNVK